MISELGTTERRFNKNIKLLKEHGYIKVHKRRKGNRNDSNLYELLMDIRDIEIAKKEFDTSRFDSSQNDSGQYCLADLLTNNSGKEECVKTADDGIYRGQQRTHDDLQAACQRHNDQQSQQDRGGIGHKTLGQQRVEKPYHQ